MKNTYIAYAKKTMIALKDPYHSIVTVYPDAIDGFLEHEDTHFMGVKNAYQIPQSILHNLKEKGHYQLHTIDEASSNGRAIDVQRINPISGNWMSGSSSGTAINVLLGINDLGIGADGGGSILAPAMSVQCFGFISPLIEQTHMKSFSRQSTDNIIFSPSIGFITRTMDQMKRAIDCVLDLPQVDQVVDAYYPDDSYIVDEVCVHEDIKKQVHSKVNLTPFRMPKFSEKRKEMIRFLSDNLPQCDCMISYEGKVDVYGLGDSVLGHFDERMQENQQKSGKFLIRVANMVNATAICVPAQAFACGYVLLCESKPDKISKMLTVAQQLVQPEDELLKRYFSDFRCYYPKPFGVQE